MSDVLDASTVRPRVQGGLQPTSSATVEPTRPQGLPRAQVDLRNFGAWWQIERVVISDDPSDGGDRARLLGFVGAINELLSSPAPDGCDPTDREVAQRVAEQLAVLVLHYDHEPSVHRLADGGILVRWAFLRGSLDIEFDIEGDDLAMITDRSLPEVDRRNGSWNKIGPDALRWLYHA